MIIINYNEDYIKMVQILEKVKIIVIFIFFLILMGILRVYI